MPDIFTVEGEDSVQAAAMGRYYAKSTALGKAKSLIGKGYAQVKIFKNMELIKSYVHGEEENLKEIK